VIAERGEVWNDHGRIQMDLHDGQILRQAMDKPNAQFIAFTTYSFDMGDFSAKAGTRQQKVGEQSLMDLINVDKGSEFYRHNAGGIATEIHQRLSTPIYALVYAFLVVVYLGRPRTTREGRVSVLFTCFMIGALELGAGITGANGVSKQALASFALLYGIPAALVFISSLLIQFDIPAPAIALPSIRLPALFRSKNAGATA
jgi:lipopolysaccharide export system permease protein